jgi:hypothetical protein
MDTNATASYLNPVQYKVKALARTFKGSVSSISRSSYKGDVNDGALLITFFLFIIFNEREFCYPEETEFILLN